MKKKYFAFLCLLLMVSLLPLSGLAVKYGDVVRITNPNAMNVRRGPGTGYGVIGEAQPTNIYIYLGEEDGWYCILFRDEVGYVAANKVTLETGLVPDDFGWGDRVEAIVRVTHGNALNVRSGPGTKYGSIGQAKSGSTWEYLGMDDGWNIINYNGSYGYIAANRTEVEVIDGGAEPTSVAAESCEYCNGTGKLTILELNAKVECVFCDGTGVQ
ncbi:MAG: SH3 domain-containing protein [Clostridia bacterium]|nr:SH3 domain-containing protein [Clostridia bacterium]